MNAKLASLLQLIDCSATTRSAAATSFLVGVERLYVIDRDLFAGPNVAQRIEEYVPVDDFHVAVGLARMVDVMRAVAATAAVNTPLRVDLTDAQLGTVGAPFCLPRRYSFARILRDLPSAPEMSRRKAALAVNRGLAYRQPLRQFQSHTDL